MDNPDLKDSIECPHSPCNLTIYRKDCSRHREYEGDGVIKTLSDVIVCSKCGRDIEIEYWIK